MLLAWYFIQSFLHTACMLQHGRFHLDFKEDHGFSGSWNALPILTTQVVKWLLFHRGVSCPFKISVAQLSHQKSWRPSWEAELSTATLRMFSPLPKLQYLGSYLFFPWELPGLQVNPALGHLLSYPEPHSLTKCCGYSLSPRSAYWELDPQCHRVEERDLLSDDYLMSVTLLRMN